MSPWPPLSDARLGNFLRAAFAVTAISLLAYVPYRYAARPPGFDGFLGSAYAILFPLATLLALGALWVAWRPAVLGRLASDGSGRSTAARWALGTYAGAWVAMGLMCLPSLTSLAAVSPVKGLFSTVHMTAQHVFLGFAGVVAAWRPELARAILAGREAGTASGADRSSGLDPEPTRG